MGHLSDTRVFTKSILGIIPKTIALAASPYSNLAIVKNNTRLLLSFHWLRKDGTSS
jgi:hypothetical protein